jgi:hypothetical protein
MSNILNYKYWCPNPTCETKHNPDFVHSDGFRGIIVRKDESEANDPEPCPCCETEMKQVGFKMHGGFSKTSLMDKTQKKAMLLNRSHKHFNKHIKPWKEHLNNEFGTQAKSIISKK